MKKTLSQRQAQISKVSAYILEYLPRIMRKFLPEKNKIIDLLSICLLLDPQECKRSEDIKCFGEVFKKLLETSVDFKVYITFAKVLAYFCEGNRMFDLFVLQPVLNEIIEKWRDTMKCYCLVCSEKNQTPLSPDLEGQEEVNLLFAVDNYCSLLWALSCHVSLEECIDLDELFALSHGTMKGIDTVPVQAMKYSFKILHAVIMKEGVNNSDDEIFKVHTEEFISVGRQVLRGKFKPSVKHSAIMCFSEHILMLRNMMVSSEWAENCWKAVSIEIVKYFSAMACKEDGLDNLNGKEKEDFMAAYLSLIERKVLSREAVIFVLMHCNKEPILRFTRIVKETMSVVQSWGMEDFAAMLYEALSIYYQSILYDDDLDNTVKNHMFEELRGIASFLMKEYGDSLTKHRKAAFKFHLNGINFSTEVRELFVDPVFAAPFIIILNIFVPVIHTNDKRKILAHLNQRINQIERYLPQGEKNEMKIYRQNLSLKRSHQNKQCMQLRSRSCRNLQEEMNSDLEDSMVLRTERNLLEEMDMDVDDTI
ncbi:uncharacterized protein [Hetaerina americana]|uniref:uncharacterized protein isoform X2 n=1 Tax=Hetaerina americana TaxID=62018 RepID=UPI003A7F1852